MATNKGPRKSPTELAAARQERRMQDALRRGNISAFLDQVDKLREDS